MSPLERDYFVDSSGFVENTSVDIKEIPYLHPVNPRVKTPSVKMKRTWSWVKNDDVTYIHK
jgi:hypothetical protein